jgi:hypothetical protein
MKELMQLEELETEVTRRAATKRDFIVSAHQLGFVANEVMREVEMAVSGSRAMSPSNTVLQNLANGLMAQNGHGPDLQVKGAYALSVPDKGEFPLNDHAHGQLAGYLNIPIGYYNRLRTSYPGLLGTNVRTLLEAAPRGEKRMVRTEAGTARAFLSNAYRPLDNDQLVYRLLNDVARDDNGNIIYKRDPMTGRYLHDPLTGERIAEPHPLNLKVQAAQNNLAIRSCAITDQKLYISLTTPKVQAKVRGDVLYAGVTIENSEIGMGSLAAWPFYEVLACTNGATMTKYGAKRRHTGQRLGSGEGDTEKWSNETRRLSDASLFMELRDVVYQTMTAETFRKMLQLAERRDRDRAARGGRC